MDTSLPTRIAFDTADATAVSPASTSFAEGTDQLEQILPQLQELAQKVGGFGKLAEIARQLGHKEG